VEERGRERGRKGGKEKEAVSCQPHTEKAIAPNIVGLILEEKGGKGEGRRKGRSFLCIPS